MPPTNLSASTASTISTNTHPWHEVGVFELEGEPSASALLTIEIARDPSGQFLVRVGADDASIERKPSAAELVEFFADYGAPFLRDLRDELASKSGFDDVCQLAHARLQTLA